jgi:hypothetical protein
MFVLERLSAEAPLLTAGMIVMGPCVGPPREIDSVSHLGEKFIIETHPADWDLVSEIGPLRIRIPMGRSAGQNGPVSWGETRLGDVPEGVRLLDAPTARAFPADPASSPFDWLGLEFQGISLCESGGGFCVGLNPQIIEGTCDLDGYANLEIDWKSWDDLCEYVGPWPWDWDCDFNPLEKAVLTAGFEADLGLVLELEGSVTDTETFNLMKIPLSKDIDIGGLEAGLFITLDLFASAGITDVKMQTGFHLNTGVDLTIGYDNGSQIDNGITPFFTFDPVFDLIDVGEGYVKVGLKPSVVFELQVIEDLADLEMSFGVPNYLEFAIDPDDEESACPNWYSSCSAKSDVEAKFTIKLTELVDIPLTWTHNLGVINLREDWGTGDLKVGTRTTGVDMDPDGYQVVVRRSDPTADPVWDEEKSILMESNADHVWNGGNCRELNSTFFDPAGVMGCDFVATRHDLVIDGIMWNCAVEGYAARMRCLEAGEQVAETFSVECVSAYAFLRDEVNAALLDGTVRNQGIARSILAKLLNAEKKRDHGDYQAAMNILSALDNYLAISAGQQVDAAFAQHLSGRVHDIMELFVWPAVTPAPQFADR